MFSRAQAILEELCEAGHRLTPQRVAIVNELACDANHPTAQALFERLRPAYPSMSFATVYNTLDALVRCGLIGALAAGNGSRAVRFDPHVSPHHHAICDGCGSVTDLPATDIALTAEIASVHGSLEKHEFQITREERIYRGLCGRCRH